MSEIINLSQQTKTFADAFRDAEEGFIRAGKIYAEAIKAHGDAAREAFASACPKITGGLWRRLESVGNGALDPRLLTAGSAGANALRRLPIPTQREALDTGVTLLVANGDTLKVQVDALQPDQVRQVFTTDHIRTPAEQRAWLETQAPTITTKTTNTTPWKVTGGQVHIAGPCKLSRIQLLGMLQEMG